MVLTANYFQEARISCTFFSYFCYKNHLLPYSRYSKCIWPSASMIFLNTQPRTNCLPANKAEVSSGVVNVKKPWYGPWQIFSMWSINNSELSVCLFVSFIYYWDRSLWGLQYLGKGTDSCMNFELRAVYFFAEGEWEYLLFLFLSELTGNSASRGC